MGLKLDESAVGNRKIVALPKANFAAQLVRCPRKSKFFVSSVFP